MRVTYDPDADAAYLYLLDPIPFGGVKQSHMCDLDVKNGAVVLNFDESGHMLGVEVLGARQLLPPLVLSNAERG